MSAEQILDQLVADGLFESWIDLDPVWQSVDRPDSLWFIFKSNEARRVIISERYGTWAELPDRCVLLNYMITWRDVQGFGVEFAHAEWAGRAGNRD